MNIECLINHTIFIPLFFVFSERRHNPGKKLYAIYRMPFLTFEKHKDAEAIAVVRGGDKDGEILYLNSSDKKPEATKKEVKAVRYMKDLRCVKPNERVKLMNRLVEASMKKTDPDSLDIPTEAKAVYKRILNDNENDTSIELPDDSTFQPIPSADPKTRQVYYIAGQSGSGKSYFARGIAENYKKLYPDRDIYLISKLNEDSTLDSMKIGKPKRISLQSLVDDPVDLEEFKDCLLIADDWDTLDKPYYTVVHKLVEDICIMGRHTNTSLLILSHYLTNYKSTRLMLNEAHFLVLYPLATSQKALKYVAEHYGGVDKEDIINFKKRGRWVCIHKSYPSYVISAHEANLLHC
jgi:hypothetical protein